MQLPASFLARPLAHRALHDVSAARPENSRAAIRAAIAAGYGIEIDLQLSSDDTAMVFHDYALDRLTGQSGPVRLREGRALSAIPLTGGDDGIPSFADVLSLVGGRVPLLVEIKDQDGALGPGVGPLEAAVARDAAGYDGPIAFMSFNPHSMMALAAESPNSVRGLVTSAFKAGDWPLVPEARRHELVGMPDLDATGACFISHDARDLDSPAVAAARARGLPVLCWTVRSAEAEAAARRFADNVTFEGYTPA